jgi:hypothetical protein
MDLIRLDIPPTRVQPQQAFVEGKGVGPEGGVLSSNERFD